MKRIDINIIIWAVLQAIICVLLTKSTNFMGGYMDVAVVLSILSGGILAGFCLGIAGRHILIRIIFTVFGCLLVLTGVLFWRSLLPWIKEQPFWGSLLFVIFMQILPYTAVMTIYSLHSIFDLLFRPFERREAQKAERKRDAAKSAETKEKYHKILLVGSPGKFVLLMLYVCAVLAAGIIFYEHVPFMERYVPPVWFIVFLVLFSFIPFRNKAYAVRELTLTDGSLRMSGKNGDTLNLPLREIQRYGISRFRPKGFGYILRMHGEGIDKAFWLVAAPAEIIDGYKGFSFAKLYADAADIDKLLKDAGIKRHVTSRDAFVGKLPMIIIIAILAVSVGALVVAG